MRVLSATHRDIQAEVAAGPLPRGPVLPPARRPVHRARRCASARTTSRGWSRTSSPSSARAPTRRSSGLERRGARAALRLRLAGERARAGERHRAGAGVRRGRGASTSARCPPCVRGGLPDNALALPPSEMSLPDILEDLERQLIQRAYDKSGGVKTETARLLGIKTSALYYKLEKYGIGVIESRSDKAAPRASRRSDARRRSAGRRRRGARSCALSTPPRRAGPPCRRGGGGGGHRRRARLRQRGERAPPARPRRPASQDGEASYYARASPDGAPPRASATIRRA